MVLLGRRCPAVWVIVFTRGWQRRGVFLRVVLPILGSRRRKEMRVTVCALSVHLGALVVLAVKPAAALLLVPSATQAAAHAPTRIAPEALYAATSTVTALIALGVAIVVAAVARVFARRGSLAL